MDACSVCVCVCVVLYMSLCVCANGCSLPLPLPSQQEAEWHTSAGVLITTVPLVCLLCAVLNTDRGIIEI